MATTPQFLITVSLVLCFAISYSRNTSGSSSRDCSQGASICHRHGFCISDLKICICKTGYAGDGINCTDVNECDANDNPCKGQDGDKCVNIEGGYICCDPLLSDDQCIAEKGAYCSGGCGNYAFCFNQTCICMDGFQGNPKVLCEDINECENKKLCSGKEEWCINRIGSYLCCNSTSTELECQGLSVSDKNKLIYSESDAITFKGKKFTAIVEKGEFMRNKSGTALIVIHGKESDSGSEEPLAETNGIVFNSKLLACNENGPNDETDCPNNSLCTQGRCHCATGYEFRPATGICIDIDECAQDSRPCSEVKGQWCINTNGGYLCCHRFSTSYECLGLKTVPLNSKHGEGDLQSAHGNEPILNTRPKSGKHITEIFGEFRNANGSKIIITRGKIASEETEFETEDGLTTEMPEIGLEIVGSEVHTFETVPDGDASGGQDKRVKVILDEKDKPQSHGQKQKISTTTIGIPKFNFSNTILFTGSSTISTIKVYNYSLPGNSDNISKSGVFETPYGSYDASENCTKGLFIKETGFVGSSAEPDIPPSMSMNVVKDAVQVKDGVFISPDAQKVPISGKYSTTDSEKLNTAKISVTTLLPTDDTKLTLIGVTTTSITLPESNSVTIEIVKTDNKTTTVTEGSKERTVEENAKTELLATIKNKLDANTNAESLSTSDTPSKIHFEAESLPKVNLYSGATLKLKTGKPSAEQTRVTKKPIKNRTTSTNPNLFAESVTSESDPKDDEKSLTVFFNSTKSPFAKYDITKMEKPSRDKATSFGKTPSHIDVTNAPVASKEPQSPTDPSLFSKKANDTATNPEMSPLGSNNNVNWAVSIKPKLASNSKGSTTKAVFETTTAGKRKLMKEGNNLTTESTKINESSEEFEPKSPTVNAVLESITNTKAKGFETSITIPFQSTTRPKLSTLPTRKETLFNMQKPVLMSNRKVTAGLEIVPNNETAEEFQLVAEIKTQTTRHSQTEEKKPNDSKETYDLTAGVTMVNPLPTKISEQNLTEDTTETEVPAFFTFTTEKPKMKIGVEFVNRHITPTNTIATPQFITPKVTDVFENITTAQPDDFINITNVNALEISSPFETSVTTTEKSLAFQSVTDLTSGESPLFTATANTITSTFANTVGNTSHNKQSANSTRSVYSTSAKFKDLILMIPSSVANKLENDLEHVFSSKISDKSSTIAETKPSPVAISSGEFEIKNVDTAESVINTSQRELEGLASVTQLNGLTATDIAEAVKTTAMANVADFKVTTNKALTDKTDKLSPPYGATINVGGSTSLLPVDPDKQSSTTKPVSLITSKPSFKNEVSNIEHLISSLPTDLSKQSSTSTKSENTTSVLSNATNLISVQETDSSATGDVLKSLKNKKVDNITTAKSMVAEFTASPISTVNRILTDNSNIKEKTFSFYNSKVQVSPANAENYLTTAAQPDHEIESTSKFKKYVNTVLTDESGKIVEKESTVVKLIASPPVSEFLTLKTLNGDATNDSDKRSTPDNGDSLTIVLEPATKLLNAMSYEIEKGTTETSSTPLLEESSEVNVKRNATSSFKTFDNRQETTVLTSLLKPADLATSITPEILLMPVTAMVDIPLPTEVSRTASLTPAIGNSGPSTTVSNDDTSKEFEFTENVKFVTVSNKNEGSKSFISTILSNSSNNETNAPVFSVSESMSTSAGSAVTDKFHDVTEKKVTLPSPETSNSIIVDESKTISKTKTMIAKSSIITEKLTAELLELSKTVSTTFENFMINKTSTAHAIPDDSNSVTTPMAPLQITVSSEKSKGYSDLASTVKVALNEFEATTSNSNFLKSSTNSLPRVSPPVVLPEELNTKSPIVDATNVNNTDTTLIETTNASLSSLTARLQHKKNLEMKPTKALKKLEILNSLCPGTFNATKSVYLLEMTTDLPVTVTTLSSTPNLNDSSAGHFEILSGNAESAEMDLSLKTSTPVATFTREQKFVTDVASKISVSALPNKKLKSTSPNENIAITSSTVPFEEIGSITEFSLGVTNKTNKASTKGPTLSPNKTESIELKQSSTVGSTGDSVQNVAPNNVSSVKLALFSTTVNEIETEENDFKTLPDTMHAKRLELEADLVSAENNTTPSNIYLTTLFDKKTPKLEDIDKETEDFFSVKATTLSGQQNGFLPKKMLEFAETAAATKKTSIVGTTSTNFDSAETTTGVILMSSSGEEFTNLLSSEKVGLEIRPDLEKLVENNSETTNSSLTVGKPKVKSIVSNFKKSTTIAGIFLESPTASYTSSLKYINGIEETEAQSITPFSTLSKLDVTTPIDSIVTSWVDVTENPHDGVTENIVSTSTSESSKVKSIGTTTDGSNISSIEVITDTSLKTTLPSVATTMSYNLTGSTHSANNEIVRNSSTSTISEINTTASSMTISEGATVTGAIYGNEFKSFSATPILKSNVESLTLKGNASMVKLETIAVNADLTFNGSDKLAKSVVSTTPESVETTIVDLNLQTSTVPSSTTTAKTLLKNKLTFKPLLNNNKSAAVIENLVTSTNAFTTVKADPETKEKISAKSTTSTFLKHSTFSTELKKDFEISGESIGKTTTMRLQKGTGVPSTTNSLLTIISKSTAVIEILNSTTLNVVTSTTNLPVTIDRKSPSMIEKLSLSTRKVKTSTPLTFATFEPQTSSILLEVSTAPFVEQNHELRHIAEIKTSDESTESEHFTRTTVIGKSSTTIFSPSSVPLSMTESLPESSVLALFTTEAPGKSTALSSSFGEGKTAQTAATTDTAISGGFFVTKTTHKLIEEPWGNPTTMKAKITSKQSSTTTSETASTLASSTTDSHFYAFYTTQPLQLSTASAEWLPTTKSGEVLGSGEAGLEISVFPNIKTIRNSTSAKHHLENTEVGLEISAINAITTRVSNTTTKNLTSATEVTSNFLSTTTTPKSDIVIEEDGNQNLSTEEIERIETEKPSGTTVTPGTKISGFISATPHTTVAVFSKSQKLNRLQSAEEELESSGDGLEKTSAFAEQSTILTQYIKTSSATSELSTATTSGFNVVTNVSPKTISETGSGSTALTSGDNNSFSPAPETLNKLTTSQSEVNTSSLPSPTTETAQVLSSTSFDLTISETELTSSVSPIIDSTTTAESHLKSEAQGFKLSKANLGGKSTVITSTTGIEMTTIESASTQGTIENFGTPNSEKQGLEISSKNHELIETTTKESVDSRSTISPKTLPSSTTKNIGTSKPDKQGLKLSGNKFSGEAWEETTTTMVKSSKVPTATLEVSVEPTSTTEQLGLDLSGHNVPGRTSSTTVVENTKSLTTEQLLTNTKIISSTTGITIESSTLKAETVLPIESSLPPISSTEVSTTIQVNITSATTKSSTQMTKTPFAATTTKVISTPSTATVSTAAEPLSPISSTTNVLLLASITPRTTTEAPVQITVVPRVIIDQWKGKESKTETEKPTTTIPQETLPPLTTTLLSTNVSKCLSNNECGMDADCERESGVCQCRPGFRGHPPYEPCKDIDECKEETNNCDDSSGCLNHVGGYQCVCAIGYRKNAKNGCVDIDECTENNGSPCARNAICKNRPGTYLCECIAGYTGDGYACINIEKRHCTHEEWAKSDCGRNHHCLIDGHGVMDCDTCKVGFTMKHGVCSDSNKCEDHSKACHTDAVCRNTMGGHLCQCQPGYAGDGHSCVDIDECATNNRCHPQSTCINTLGSYTCQCPEGWTGDGFTACLNPADRTCAQRSDFCQTKGGNNSACLSISVGNSFQSICECLPNYRLNSASGECEDIDECLENRDNCDTATTTCVNTPGSFLCNCISGYEGLNGVCVDIDECQRGIAGCHVNAHCINQIGGVKCRCAEGFTGDGTDCIAVDEHHVTGGNDCNEAWVNMCRSLSKTCHIDDEEVPQCGSCLFGFQPIDGKCLPINAVGNCADPSKNDCDVNAECIDVRPGRHFCSCKVGYIGDGMHCDDVDECSIPRLCDIRAYCKNTNGSYECHCKLGFIGNGFKCVPATHSQNCRINPQLCHENAGCQPDGTCKCLRNFEGDGVFVCDVILESNITTHAPQTTMVSGLTYSTESLFLTTTVDSARCSEHDRTSCHILATCDVDAGECVCRQGFMGNGYDTCTRMWEDCTVDETMCHANATCERASRQCICNLGHIGDGISCVPDKMDCIVRNNVCSDLAQCIARRCVCKPGYTGDGSICMPLEPPFEVVGNCSACHSRATCVNGSICSCNQGCFGNGIMCVPDPQDCMNYPGVCHINGVCDTAVRRCVCKKGFFGNGLDCSKRVSCTKDALICHANAKCLSDGRCKCNEGLIGDGVECHKVITASEIFQNSAPQRVQFECELKCGINAECINGACRCQTGFITNLAAHCEDIDECKMKTASCHVDAQCFNIEGSYECRCNDGFFGDGRNCYQRQQYAPLGTDGLKVECKDGGINLLLTDEVQPFTGRVFVRGQSENPHCTKIFSTTSNKTDLSFFVSLVHCDMHLEADNTLAVTVVIQKHSIFITEKAYAYRLRCAYPTSTRTLMTHYNMSDITTAETIREQGSVPQCQLTVTNENDVAIDNAIVGQLLTLTLSLVLNDIFTVVPRSCYAINLETNERYSVTDEAGCAVDEQLFPEWTRVSPALTTATFSTFKWADSSMIRFECDCAACIDNCPQINCERRRQVIQSSTKMRFARDHDAVFSDTSEIDAKLEKESQLIKNLDLFESSTPVFSSVVAVADNVEERLAQKQMEQWLTKGDANEELSFFANIDEKRVCIGTSWAVVCLLSVLFSFSLLITMIRIYHTRVKATVVLNATTIADINSDASSVYIKF